MQTRLEMCDVEGVCTPAEMWNMSVTGLCSKGAASERAVKRIPSESWQTTLPNAAQVFLYPGLAQIMRGVAPAIFRSRGLSSAGTALVCWGEPPRQEDACSFHSLFYHTRTALWFPHMYIAASRCIFPSPPLPRRCMHSQIQECL